MPRPVPNALPAGDLGTPPEPAGAPCPGEEGISPDRRRFFARVSMALAGVSAAAVSVPVVGFLLAPLFGRPTHAWSGASGRSAAWLRRAGGAEFAAFAIECTHLGCPVRWLASSQLFMCPCHGGVYYADGAVAAGPPPRALTRYPVRVEGGRVLVGAGPLPLTRA